jgi:hypothetical protein
VEEIWIDYFFMLCDITTRFHFMVIYCGHIKYNVTGVVDVVQRGSAVTVRHCVEGHVYFYVILCISI